jgi:large subunit ribosomal protein L10
LKNAGVDEEFIKLFVGPVAVAVDYEDITAGVKTLSKFIEDKKNKSLEIKGGYIEGRVCGAEEVEALSKLPGKDELRATLLSLLQTPARNFVSLCSAPSRNLLGVLSNYAEKKSE